MTTLLILALVILGAWAFFFIPVSDLPPIEYPQITITAGYPGADAETVLNQLTIPLEKELVHVKGTKEIASVSTRGHVKIALSFDLEKNMDLTIRDVQAALNRSEKQIPKDIDPRPTFKMQGEGRESVMYLLLTSNRDKDNSGNKNLQEYAETYILPRLHRLSGVANVKIYGNKPSIFLKLNPEWMTARQIGFNQVLDAVKEYTAQRPLGSLEKEGQSVSIELSPQKDPFRDLENLKVGKAQVRLKEIGALSDQPDHQQEFYYISQGQKSVALILGIQKGSEANVIALSDSLQKMIETVNRELPPGLHLDLWFNKALWIEESIADVEWSLAIAFCLVVLVIYLSLGRILEAILIACALPLSLLGTFALMHAFHFSLNLLSLIAVTLAVGF
ncbi:MAG TPA: efflux RND transporter permease subunit, partial [Chlamydiales bacterium]|nr:efflux RND transporter permease subunit [Chlamydiales bacterium]